MITIGIDPHKNSLTAVALHPTGQTDPPIWAVMDRTTAAVLLAWAAQWPDRQWAVEGATGLGRGIAQQLVTAGEVVVDVPAKLAARARLLGSSSARKTDVADAISVAAVALHNRRLNRAQVEDHTTIMRLLTERRDDLVAEHTRHRRPSVQQLTRWHRAPAVRACAPGPFREPSLPQLQRSRPNARTGRESVG